MSSFEPTLSILASAGSGKTFQLSHRYLRLLAMEVPPEQIGAFTFSRKAAGEIFDSTVHALRDAAATDSGAEAASRQIQTPREKTEFLNDLRILLRALPQIKVGTLDAHIARLLSAVSIELGLPSEFALQDDLSAEQVRLRREILNQLFRSSELTEEHAALFLQLFEEATHGKSSKEFLKPMLGFLENHRDAYRSFPSRADWKGPLIGDPPLQLPPELAKQIAKEITKGLQAADLHKGARTSLVSFAECCAGYAPGSTWSKQIPKGKTIEWVFSGDSPVLDYSRKTTDLSGPVWEGLQKLADHVVAIEWEKAQRKTEALWGFLHLYETAYAQIALPGGRLTFDDACTLMADFDLLTPSELAYRLDGEIDHWLLDEFQDTSRPQWRVLKPFLAEILQDPEERRSLFFVGDIKQAIYGWRGGDAGLFEQILHTWPRIQKQEMSTSYRSAQPVLDAVNQVFAELPASEALSPETSQRWNNAFHSHTSAKTELTGWAGFRQLEKDGVPLEEVVLEHLRELPKEASIALLVRGNTEGDIWAVTLREAGFRVSREGSSPLRDNSAVEAVLAGLRHTVHPADTFSKRLCQLAGLPLPGIQELVRSQAEGITSLVQQFRQLLNLDAEADYARSRLDLLEAEALEFDQRHSPDIDAFLEHIDQLKLRESGNGSGVRIMTIHQCKGLGFDAVILPLKERSGFSSRLEGLITSPPDSEKDWVTLLPPKAACARIPELQHIIDQETDRATYETLCVLYVAMTRAKRSLYVVLPPPSKSPNTFANWIPTRLGTTEPTANGLLAEWGKDQWKTDLHPPQAETATALPFGLSEGTPGVKRLEPSREHAAKSPIEREFRAGSDDGRLLGSTVHDVLETLDYVKGDPETFLSQHQLTEADPAHPHITAAWQMPELQEPEGVVELWREQKFETLLPEGWVTGIFDRVVIFEDRAWIQDYKTNKAVTPETVEHYRPQMDLYRKVLSDMLEIAEDRIECHLLFTATGQVEKV